MPKFTRPGPVEAAPKAKRITRPPNPRSQYDPETIPAAQKMLMDLVEKTPYTVAQVIGRRRLAALVNVRESIAKNMYHMGGFSYPVIAVVMNRDHSSIYHLINKRGKSKKGVYNSDYKG